MIKEEIKQIIQKAIAGFTKEAPDFSIEASADKQHGDYSSNIALVLAKRLGKNPKEAAESIKNKINSDNFEKIEIAGPGFINFFIKDKFFIDEIKKINKNFGKSGELKKQRIILDYTNPNILKEFHIGHLMNNTIGESLSRIFEFHGAKVKRVCYQSDVGLGVARAVWGKMKDSSLEWGEAYALGYKAFKEDDKAKQEIIELNKKIYEKSDKKINKLYGEGKRASLKHFGEIYKRLGAKFDWLIFESETAALGKKIVEKGLKGGIFEKGENGAIIFKGEKYGLHTRVFINSEGLPTYEAKDLGLAEIKYKKYKYDKSIIVTGNEVNEYFKVMLAAMDKVLPKLAKKTQHIGHGVLRLPEGKMSSRTGSVITAESLMEKIKELILEKIKDRDLSDAEKGEISEKVAIGAIKYSILKQSIGSDIIYDFDKSISFEGDSGPYLQYSHTRAQSVLRKAEKEGVRASFKKIPGEITRLEKTMSYFPDMVSQANKNYEPHFLVLYLTGLASAFNNYYAKNRIVYKPDEFSPYKVALTNSFAAIMKNGLWLLGIETLRKM